MPDPVIQYARRLFATPAEALTFRTRLTAAARSDAAPASSARTRIVAFARPAGVNDAEVYVSAGAQALARQAGLGGRATDAMVDVGDLPPGLELVLGDSVDASEYARRASREGGSAPL